MKTSITAIVTDNAANMVKCVKDYFGSSYDLLCFAHIIQSISEWAIKLTPNSSEIINNVIKIFTFCNQNTLTSDGLFRLQYIYEKIERTLQKVIQKEDTR